MHARTRWTSPVALLALTLVGCGAEDPVSPPPPPPPPPVPVASVYVTPETGALFPGQTQLLTAIPRDSAGAPLPVTALTWTTDAPAFATVSANGTVTAIAPGVATITATIAGKSGQAVITVNQVVGPIIVDRVDLDAREVALVEGISHSFVATPRSPTGAPVNGLGMTWSSSHPDIVSVNVGNGVATALRPGTAVITVRVHGKEASATVQVTSTLSHDLLFTMWAGVPGQPPVLGTVDPRDPLRTVLAVPPGDVTGSRPSVSPDGSRIAFARHTWWGPLKIHVLDRATGTVTLLSDPASPFDQIWEDSPAWSPDGEFIAFRRAEVGEPKGIWVMRPNGADRRRVTPIEPGVNFFHPTWSPGSNWIAYTRESFGIGHIWSIRLDGTGARQHTTGEVYDMQPAWSPDGEWIAFIRAGITANLRRVHVGTGSVSILVHTPTQTLAPAWSPDGSQIAFLARPTINSLYEVFTAFVGEGPLRVAQRTADGTEKGFPAWLPR